MKCNHFNFQANTICVRKDVGLMKSDEELFHGFQRGETVCFEQLVLRYRRKLTCYIYRIIADADAAEDVAQDVFAMIR